MYIAISMLSFAEYAKKIRSGNYRPRESDVVTLEKKLGIPRRLVIPAATDALVLQTLIDVLEKQIKTKQPTGNAYYSRSHALPPISVDSLVCLVTLVGSDGHSSKQRYGSSPARQTIPLLLTSQTISILSL